MASTEPTDPLSSALVGTVLASKYCLEAILGTGGMATVFAATHRNGGRFAIKVLHDRYAQDESMRARFLREGYAANRVGHAGALRVLDDDVTPNGIVFLVLELLDGETVGHRAARSGKTLPPLAVLAIAHQTLDVLAAAHAQGIIHRDIKPDNLFVSRGGGITVLDFGIARLSDASAVALATQTGMTLGTPAFMAPEQALGHAQQVGARTDLWALGATLFYVLTGRFVHRGTTPQEIAAYAATRPAPRLAAVMPELHAEVCALVDGALEFDPEARFIDAAAMRVAVERAHLAVAGRVFDSASAKASLAFTPENEVSWGASGSTELMDDSARSTAGATADPSLASGSPRRRRERRVMTATVFAAAAALASLLFVVSRSPIRNKGVAEIASARDAESGAPVRGDDELVATRRESVAARGVIPLPPSSAMTTTADAPLVAPVVGHGSQVSATAAKPSRKPNPPVRALPSPGVRAPIDAGATNTEDLYKP